MSRRTYRMRFHPESSRRSYDVVVVGSGIGGLTAGALLARAGRSVLVIERHDRPGGYAHAFRRRQYLFDSAVHLVGGCEATAAEGGALIHDLLCALGVRERCAFEKIDPCYAVRYPGFALDAASGIEPFIGAYVEKFPREEEGIRALVGLCREVRREARRASDIRSAREVVRAPSVFPALLEYRRATLSEVVDRHLSDPKLKAAFATLWPYLGLPPSRVSFLYWATMLMSYVADGAYYCRGTFQSFADALADAVENHGGEVLLRAPVRRIRVEGGRAAGVVLENGQRIDASLVVSNADAVQTVEELVGPAAFPSRYLSKLRYMKPSVSAFVVYAAVKMELGGDVCHETFFYQGWDHDDAYRSGLAGEPSWLTITIPTLADPQLAPPGEHLIILTTLIPYDAVPSWRAGKQRLVERLVSAADRCLPGLRQGLTFAEGATPRTMERYTRNTAGAIYGWDLSPDQISPARLGNETPLPGLYLAGHWTQPGGGIYGVVTSGVQTARAVLGCAREADLWERLRGEAQAGANPTRRVYFDGS
jgi:phytoene desaturase